MNIICKKDILVTAVSNVSRAVSQRSPIPALEGIHIKAKENSICLTGYNLELGIQTTLSCDVLEEGEIVLSAKFLLDMIRRIESEDVSIKSNPKFLTTINGGVTEYTILGMSPEEFPELPVIQSISNVTLSQGNLKSQIEQTLFAVATTDSKPVHTGSLFDIYDKSVTVVSVDGYRLAMRKEQADINEEITFIVPGKTLSEVAKLIKDGENDQTVDIKVSRKQILFKIGDYNIISRLLEGEFLDYKASIPSESKTDVTIATRDFINSIERTSLLISDRLRSPLRIKFSEDLIKINCTTSLGKAYDEVACKIEGQEVEMGFNNKYLLDALRACDCDQVKLEINGPLSPMKVVPMEGDSFLFLVLPVRLKNE